MERMEERKDYMNYTQRKTTQFSLPSNETMTAPISFSVTKRDGGYEPFNIEKIKRTIQWAQTGGYEEDTDIGVLLEETVRNCFDKISLPQIADTLILAAVAFIERDPAYGYIAARLLFKKLY